MDKQKVIEARRKLADLIHEAGQLEDMEHRRDLNPHEWSRLCALYQDIRVLESFLDNHLPG